MHIKCSVGKNYQLQWNDYGKYYACFVNDVSKHGKSFPVFSNLVSNTTELNANLESYLLEFVYHQPSDCLQVILKQDKASSFLQQGSVKLSYNVNYIETLLENEGVSAIDILVGIKNKFLVHEPVLIDKPDIKYINVIFVILFVVITSSIFQSFSS